MGPGHWDLVIGIWSLVMDFYNIANIILRLLFRILLRVQVTGLERIPRQGPLIVASNHVSFLDPLLAGVLFPRRLIFMSKIENYQIPIFGLLVRAYSAFPIRRGEVDRAALRQSMAVLHAGQALYMAPEGTRSPDGRLQAGHDGMTLIATRTGAPVLPVATWGGENFKHDIRRMHRTEVHLIVGEPFHYVSSTPKPGRDELRVMTTETMYRIAQLLPPERRGVYADIDQATQDYLSFDTWKIEP